MKLWRWGRGRHGVFRHVLRALPAWRLHAGRLQSRIGRAYPEKARHAGMLLHGGNSMGFSISAVMCGCRASIPASIAARQCGPAQPVGRRHVGHTGLRRAPGFPVCRFHRPGVVPSVEDYLDYVLDLPATRVVGLFLETSRQPHRFIAALEGPATAGADRRAQGRQDGTGRQARRFPQRRAGRQRRHVRCVVSPLWGAAGGRYGPAGRQPHPVRPAAAIAAGWPGHLHDSGGERRLAIDLADTVGVAYPQLVAATVAQLETILDEGLPAVNPLDAWGSGGADAAQYMQTCFTALMSDPGIAWVRWCTTGLPGSGIYPDYLQYLRGARAATGKPVCLVANYAGSGSDRLAVEATREGLPVLDGLREFRSPRAASWRTATSLPWTRSRHRLRVRRMWWRAGATIATTSCAAAARWAKPLRGRCCGTSASRCWRASLSRAPGAAGSAAVTAVSVVLKTARVDIAHKSDVGGVLLNLADTPALSAPVPI